MRRRPERTRTSASRTHENTALHALLKDARTLRHGEHNGKALTFKRNAYYAGRCLSGTTVAMRGMGKRLKARARSLKMTDADVARRVGVSQPRYANYVNDANEPDLSTLVGICKALDTSPDEMLGFAETPVPSESDLLNARVHAAVAFMDVPRLRIAAALLDTLAKMPKEKSDG